MVHAESNLLYVAEVVHWVALGIMALVYLIRLKWLFSWTAGRDRQKPGEHGVTGSYPGFYSMMNVVMPWQMESTRKGFPFYLSFVFFHLGVTAGIGFAVTGSLIPWFYQIPAVAYLFMGIIGLACLIAIIRIVRRAVLPHLRLISTPDDWFAIFTLAVWFALGVPAVGYVAGVLPQQGFLVAYLFATSFFLVYVPFSKISHYLYYPFTRYWLGKTLGHRGSLLPQKSN